MVLIICLLSILLLIIGVMGAGINLGNDNIGVGATFVFITFFIALPNMTFLLNYAHNYAHNYENSQQTYCTKFYNNNVNNYKKCMNKDLSIVITKGLK